MLITVHFRAPSGESHPSSTAQMATSTAVKAKVGQTLMKAAVAANVSGIAADCGGCLTCATCHVLVEPAWSARLPPATSQEDAMLDMTASPREARSRLSCQILLEAAHDGLVVDLPANQY